MVRGAVFQLLVFFVKYLVQMVRKPDEMVILTAPKRVATVSHGFLGRAAAPADGDDDDKQQVQQRIPKKHHSPERIEMDFRHLLQTFSNNQKYLFLKKLHRAAHPQDA